MGLSGLKNSFFRNIKNIPGKGTRKKIVVIECDDWGSIRMPSKEIYKELLKDGFPVDKSRYARYDTLASKEDLELLFEALESVRDHKGNPAVMTPVVNVANPDFKKIRDSGLKEYHLELFTKTLERYGHEPGTFETWQKGMKKGIFVPESHGREHLTVQLWMQRLQASDQDVLKGFELGYVSVPVKNLEPIASHFRPEFYFNHKSQVPFLKESITSGVTLFKELFGYVPRAFAPTNGIFHPVFETVLAQTGVKYLYVSHLMPIPDGKGGVRKKYYPAGKTGKTGLTYYTRNCAIEPTDENYKGLELTLKQIEAAFRWGKPANISTHRVNFVGGMAEDNRAKGLSELRRLLQAIVKCWPDVEFMSSADMFKAVYESRDGA